MIFVSPGDVYTEISITYKDSYDCALDGTLLLKSIETFSVGSVVVLYFHNHYDDIL
ncbi:hypothetical protein P171DRAFT_426619 [Karstenula rhodostoma CBS 690.94]|uniref:Uncharacterized protein n=1 Tax=Karstenula rhodostoma CBS 690.94 TaxID=1392251 RepID=A0A9P4PRU6_9PLEO|nr:hypothetical protein P171DRAFT_426619 [Karstenula rhodostoma CBS 690.94]